HLVRSDSWYLPPFAAAKAGRNFPFVNPQQRRAESCQRKANIFRKKFLQAQKNPTAQGSRDRT
ncbi:hypothetical protein HMPREF1987_01256, partial [Peptostreptococcaceae bacterium oral taxon 113 str. W5053]